MSHKTQIALELKDRKYLTKALDALGFTYKEGDNLTTKGNYNVHEKVDILIESNGKEDFNGAVGFKKNADGTYTAVGDFYGLQTESGRQVTEDMLKCEVTSHSKECELNDRLASLMFSLEAGSRKETNSEISYTCQRWVN